MGFIKIIFWFMFGLTKRPSLSKCFLSIKSSNTSLGELLLRSSETTGVEGRSSTLFLKLDTYITLSVFCCYFYLSYGENRSIDDYWFNSKLIVFVGGIFYNNFDNFCTGDLSGLFTDR